MTLPVPGGGVAVQTESRRAALAEARALIEHRRLALAEEIAVRNLAGRDRSTDWILLLAEIRLDQQRHQESLQLLDGARRLGDFSAQNRLLAGLNYVALNRMDLAEPELRAAAELDPSKAPPFYYLGRLLYTRNFFSEAIKNTKKAIELDPDLVRAYDNLGLCYEAIGKAAEAEQAYIEGVNRQRKSGAKVEWPALNFGIMLLKRGEYGRAKPYVEEALKINSTSAEAHFRLGSILEQEGDLAGALAQYKDATTSDPKLASAYYRASRIYQRLGRTTEAQQQFLAFQQNSGKKDPN